VRWLATALVCRACSGTARVTANFANEILDREDAKNDLRR